VKIAVAALYMRLDEGLGKLFMIVYSSNTANPKAKRVNFSKVTGTLGVTAHN
jgi:hypothetical protein